jgi:hypothetical protein
MIPARTHYEMRTFGDGDVGSCTMTNVAHMQQLVLTMGYQDKLVFVRELIHNAVDSMLRAEKPEEPVVLHLPDDMEPVFWIRDYGTGMTHQRFMEVYADLGGSDKRSEAISTGALGIGSKSPLVYANAFNIQCFDGQYVRTYVIGWGSDGCVTYQAHPLVPSDEPTGVLVAVPIAESDFRSVIKRTFTVASRLNHPHVPRVALPVRHDGNELDGGAIARDLLRNRFDALGMPADGVWDKSFRSVSPHVWLYSGYVPDSASAESQLFRLRRSEPDFSTVAVYMGRVVYQLDVEQLVADLPEDQRNALTMLGMVSQDFRICIPTDADGGSCPVTFDAGRERLQLSDVTVKWVYPVLLAAATKIESYYRGKFATAATHIERVMATQKHGITKRASSYLLPQLPAINGGPTGIETLSWLRAAIGKYLPGLNLDALVRAGIVCRYDGDEIGATIAHRDTASYSRPDRLLSRLVSGFSDDYEQHRERLIETYGKMKALPMILVDDTRQWKKRLERRTQAIAVSHGYGLEAYGCDYDPDADVGDAQAAENKRPKFFTFKNAKGKALTPEQCELLKNMLDGQYEIQLTSELPKLAMDKLSRTAKERKQFRLERCYRLVDERLRKLAATGAYRRLSEYDVAEFATQRRIVLRLEGTAVRLGDGIVPCNSDRLDQLRRALRQLRSEVDQVVERDDLMLSNGELLLYRRTEMDTASLPAMLVPIEQEIAQVRAAMYEVSVWRKLYDHLFGSYTDRLFIRVLHKAGLTSGDRPIEKYAEFLLRFESTGSQLLGLRDATQDMLAAYRYSIAEDFKRAVKLEADRLLPTIEHGVQQLHAAYPILHAIDNDVFDWDSPDADWYREQMRARTKKKSYLRMQDLPELPILPGTLEHAYFAGLRLQGYLGAKRAPRKRKCKQSSLTSS